MIERIKDSVLNSTVISFLLRRRYGMAAVAAMAILFLGEGWVTTELSSLGSYLGLTI